MTQIDINDLIGTVTLYSNCVICNVSISTDIKFPVAFGTNIISQGICSICGWKLKAMISLADQINNLK